MKPLHVLTCLLLSLTIVAESDAQKKSKVAYTDPASTDGDFPYQGEYFASVNGATFAHPYLGLQVVAHGGTSFGGRLLPGGLPGAGWNRQDETQLSGVRDGTDLVMQGGDYLVRVAPEGASIISAAGEVLGHLPKIRRISPTLNESPPRDAIVLFDGTSTEHFEGGKIVDGGLLDVGVTTKMPVGDFRMHLEFRLPYMPHARSQGRGNSGVYIQRRYEVQILDSFGLEGVHNECGGLYKQRAPAVNMCYPPLRWQTYDIFFTAARWNASGKKAADARITVLHNGEPIHDDYAIKNKTGAGKPEGPEPLPILLQNHSDPVRFRNVWLVPGTGKRPQPPRIECLRVVRYELLQPTCHCFWCSH